MVPKLHNLAPDTLIMTLLIMLCDQNLIPNIAHTKETDHLQLHTPGRLHRRERADPKVERVHPEVLFMLAK